MKLLYVLLFWSILYPTNAQKKLSRVDSLVASSNDLEGAELVKIYNEISWEYRNSDPQSALDYARKSLEIAKKVGDDQLAASAYNSIATSHEAASRIDSALTNHEKSLKLKLKLNDDLGIADSYNNIGIIYDKKGNYNDALESYFNALRIYEKYEDDDQKIPMVYVNIGIVYKKQKEFQKVLDYYTKALKIYKENNNYVGEVITTGNIGSVLINLKRYDASIDYLKRGKKLYDSLGYSRYVPYMDVNIGIALDSLKRYNEAKAYYLASVNAFENDNNLYELSSAKINFARNLSKTKNYNQAKDQLISALKISRENNFSEMEVKGLKEFSKVEYLLRNYKDAFLYLKNYSHKKDSIFETDKVKSLLELGVKYETEKKEREILEQRTLIAEKEVVLQRRNYQIIGSLGLALVLALLGYLFYNQQRLKNVQLIKEKELKEALQKIETQNRLQEQRLRISRDLHDNIGAQLTFIISSIDNLKYGFELPDKLENKLSSISEFTYDTISELRDTIWAMNKNEISFEDLQMRVSNFIEKANLASKNIEFSFDVSYGVDSNIVFTSVEGMNIYRIIQEAVNNAIKYAEASSISIRVMKENNLVSIYIKDDGKGFEMTKAALGNGINNMKKRAEEINANFNLVSNVSQGTEIELTLKS